MDSHDSPPPDFFSKNQDYLFMVYVQFWCLFTHEYFLPPYSADFNPIEKMWSKLKALLGGLEARIQEGLS